MSNPSGRVIRLASHRAWLNGNGDLSVSLIIVKILEIAESRRLEHLGELRRHVPIGVKTRTGNINELRARNTCLQAPFHPPAQPKTRLVPHPGSVNRARHAEADDQKKTGLECPLRPRRSVDQPGDVKDAQNGSGERDITTREPHAWAEPGSR